MTYTLGKIRNPALLRSLASFSCYATLVCVLLLARGKASTTPAYSGTIASSTSTGSAFPGTGGSSDGSSPTPTGPGVLAAPGTFNVKLAPFSAKGDGVTDDTLAIRTALAAACTAGGGEVWFPEGTYIISPQISSENAALTVSCDNITLAGAGAGLSTLSRKTLGDTDPDKTCPMNNGQVNRGYGIYVSYKADGDHLRHSFHMQDLSLLGNRTAYTGINGSNTWPASETNCFNVWDVSDKGLFVGGDATDVQLLRTEIGYFAGELLFGGGQNSTGWIVSSNNIHHSNGDGISISAAVHIVNNQVHAMPSDGIENQPYGAAEPQFISGNNIYDVGLDAIDLPLVDPIFYNAPPPSIEVASNKITNAHRYGVMMLSRSGSIHDNQIFDTGMPSMLGCGIALIGMQNGTTWEIPQNITVRNNTILAKTVTTQCGVEVYTAAEAGVTAWNDSIIENTIGPLKPAADGIFMRSSIYIANGTRKVNLKNNKVN